jgi:hypothetical protein
MLQIQLGKGKPADPNDDLGRSRLGYHDGMDETEAWLVGRGDWAFRTDRALEHNEVQVVNADGIVLAVAELRGVTRCRDGRRRFFLEGALLEGDPRVGKPTHTPHPSRNPVAYF